VCNLMLKPLRPATAEGALRPVPTGSADDLT
jgi:hypothetical protein